MSDIIQQLRESKAPFSDQIIDHIEHLEERLRHQHVVLDKAASIMVEATTTEDGIDPEQADACVDQIRGLFTEIGETTVEHYMGLIYAKVGQLAGIPPDDEFDVMAELDKLGAAAAIGRAAKPMPEAATAAV